MRRHLAVLVFVSAACGPAAPPPVPERTPLQSLRSSIDSLLDDPRFENAHLGLMVVNAATKDTLYSRNAGKLFMPASNQKIITSAVALAQLGRDYRYRTVIAKRGTIKDSVLNGDLIIIGKGDPTMSDRVQGSAAKAMAAIADSIRARGIRRVTGAIRQGGNAFPDSIYGYGWEWDDLSGESGAPVDELFYNEGMMQRAAKIDGRDTVISVATRSPGYVYLGALYSALTQRGIPVTGLVNLTADSLVVPYDTVYVIESPPLHEILKHFMKPSQNQIGEALLKTIGLEKTGIGTADAGAEVVTRQLSEWGIDSTEVVYYDGSGLSRHDLVSPRAIIKILMAMRGLDMWDDFYNSFPIAGVDGTIRSRMKGTKAENNLRGKTGTIEFVRSLSGYVDAGNGVLLTFSFLSNHFTTPVSEITKIQDAVGELLANFIADEPKGPESK